MLLKLAPVVTSYKQFFADILWPKKLQSQTVIRNKAVQSTFILKSCSQNVGEIET